MVIFKCYANCCLAIIHWGNKPKELRKTCTPRYAWCKNNIHLQDQSWMQRLQHLQQNPKAERCWKDFIQVELKRSQNVAERVIPEGLFDFRATISHCVEMMYLQWDNCRSAGHKGNHCLCGHDQNIMSLYAPWVDGVPVITAKFNIQFAWGNAWQCTVWRLILR